ncbi:MAG: 4-diphosphocytidyl-2-C-methyl-D-erythritol kinase [Solirubrobacteraceae bacterium]|nr:4-diphosphocytidyl-2-C-methyl-D-erythritol kinase [Solirubrobacteraceae bacterium]
MIGTTAPGKVNLCLFVGAPRADGYHPLVSVFQSVSLADELTLEVAGDRDEVVCPGVAGPNLAARAVVAYREASGWDGPPVRITITKRVPVAAGMGGGSGDAAAALRLAAEAAGRPGDPLLARIAPTLGADVPFQLVGGRALVTGIGERVEPLPAGPPPALVVYPSAESLSTAAVYAEADRLGLGRDLAAAERDVRAGALPNVNDLQDAARSLCPSIDRALDQLLTAGAVSALVAGSGPTVFGSFDDPERAGAVAAVLPGAVAVAPL